MPSFFFFRKGGLDTDSEDFPGLVSVAAYLKQLSAQENERKPTDAEGFLRELDAVPWSEVMAAWLVEQAGPLPALVLCSDDMKVQFGVSGIFHEQLHYYQCTFNREVKKGWFSKETQNLSFEIHARDDVAGLVRQFVQGDCDALAEEARRIGQNFVD